MPTIAPCLWFDGQAEEAVDFYTSIFRNSKVGGVSRHDGAVLMIEFELDGRPFMALNGGPMFKFTEAVSMFVSCANQAEVDERWNGLLEGGGTPQQCGWLKDRYGLSWQIVPTALGELMRDKDREKAGRVLQAMMKMVKFDVDALKRAYDGAEP